MHTEITELWAKEARKSMEIAAAKVFKEAFLTDNNAWFLLAEEVESTLDSVVARITNKIEEELK